MIDKKMILSLGKKLERRQYVSAPDGVVAAVKLLQEHGVPLTELQKEVIMFAVEVVHRTDSDTWDHEFRGYPDLGSAGDRVVELLEEFVE